MGGLPGLVGLGSGAAGTSFSGPQSANIQNPTSLDQISNAYNGVQGALGSQQALLAALQQQQGIQNQNQVYGQLQGVASGAVNPAQAQFANNTSANVANQAALMAGQRGAGANVGLMARQAAQAGAGIQQQAVGQEAAQQAQNQIAAIGQAGNLATTQAGQQIGQTNANVQAQQAEQGNLLNAMQGYNTNQVAMQSNMNTANAGLAGIQMGGQQTFIGGGIAGAATGMSGGGGGAAAAGGAGGGEIVKMANGTPGGYDGADIYNQAYEANATQPQDQLQTQKTNVPNSIFGKFISRAATNISQQQDQSQNQQAGNQSLYNGMKTGMTVLVKSLKGNGSGDTSSATEDYAHGGMTKDFRAGGKVKATSPKEKAVAKGNDYANDKIPAVLSEHEIVLPRTVTLSKDPVNAAAQFVANIVSKRKVRK